VKYRPYPGSASAEAIFGSSARGDADLISDRDILIVDDDLSVLRRRANELKDSGWSVAPYTFRKLEALSRIGALFVQHLKLESDIQVDRAGRLAEVFASFSPKASYQSEISENARLAELVATHPDTPKGCLWAADVLYVAVRNFGILSLAEKNVFKFSYSEVVDALVDAGFIKGKLIRSELLHLRLLKSLYRSGEVVAMSLARTSIARALDGLPDLHFPKKSIPVSPTRLLAISQNFSDDVSAYCCLRNLEKCFVAASSIRKEIHADRKLDLVTKWIENPRAYASLSKKAAPGILHQLRGYVLGPDMHAATIKRKRLRSVI